MTIPAAGRLTARVFLVSVLVVLSSVVVAGGSAAESACSNFSATAAADGFRSAGTVPGFLVVETADGQGPAAQARVDSLSRSEAHAGFVYSAAALDNASSRGADKNSVPMVAATSYPARPAAETSNSAGSVKAASDARSSSAVARAGTAGTDTAGRATAAAVAKCDDDGAVSANAETITEALSFGGGLLRIGQVRSFARVEVDPQGNQTLQSGAEIDGVTVGSQRVSITEKGLIVGGSTSATPSNPLATALAAAGISVTYIAGSKDADGSGIIAPGLRVTLDRQVPGVGTAPSSISYTFGRSYARGASAPDAAETEESEFSFAGQDGAPLASSFERGAGRGTTLAPPAGLDSPVAFGEDAAAPTASAGRGGAGSSAIATPVSASVINDAPLASVYPALVAAAAVLIAAWFVFDRLGVKLRWR